jgi:transcriptional regulator with XRE-family HTH domain
MSIETNFGAYLKSRLTELGMTVEQTIAHGGFTKTSVTEWLNNDIQDMSMDNIVKLAQILEVSPHFILQFGCHTLAESSSRIAGQPEDIMTLVEEINFPDNSPVFVNQRFKKRWKIQNSGNKRWHKRYFKCTSSKIHATNVASMTSTRMRNCLTETQPTTSVKPTNPGDTTEVEIELIAPPVPGNTKLVWKMYDSTNTTCFPNHPGIWCDVRVMQL